MKPSERLLATLTKQNSPRLFVLMEGVRKFDGPAAKCPEFQCRMQEDMALGVYSLNTQIPDKMSDDALANLFIYMSNMFADISSELVTHASVCSFLALLPKLDLERELLCDFVDALNTGSFHIDCRMGNNEVSIYLVTPEPVSQNIPEPVSKLVH